MFYFIRPFTDSKKRPHGNEPFVAGTGHSEVYPGWRMLPMRLATDRESNKHTISGMKIKKVADIAPVQPHYYCVRWVE